jgi:hypothetical protein
VMFLLLQFNCKRSMLKLVLKAQPNMTVLSIIALVFGGYRECYTYKEVMRIFSNFIYLQY